MKSTLSATIIFFICVSLAALFSILWLVDFSQLNIPERIPGLELRTYGVLILIAFIIFYLLQKRLIKLNIESSVFKLVIASTLVAFLSLLIYQGIRQHIILRGQFSYDILSVLLSSAIPTILLIFLAATIALDLKKVKGLWRHIPTLIMMILFIFTKQYFQYFEW